MMQPPPATAPATPGLPTPPPPHPRPRHEHGAGPPAPPRPREGRGFGARRGAHRDASAERPTELAQLLQVQGLAQLRVRHARAGTTPLRGVKAPPVMNTTRPACSGDRARASSPVQVHAGHPRHHQVAEHDVEALARPQQRPAPRARCGHAPPRARRRASRRSASADAAARRRPPAPARAAPAAGRRAPGGGSSDSRSPRRGQQHAEGGALAPARSPPSISPPSAVDDAVADGQPQPGAHARPAWW